MGFQFHTSEYCTYKEPLFIYSLHIKKLWIFYQGDMTVKGQIVPRVEEAAFKEDRYNIKQEL
jgi:hypothetical protein